MSTIPRRFVLKSALRATAGAAIARLVGLWPELQVAHAAPAAAASAVRIEYLSPSDASSMLAEAQATADFRLLQTFLTSRGFSLRNDQLVAFQASDQSSTLRSLVADLDGGTGATLVFVAGSGFTAALARVVHGAAYVVRDGLVVQSVEATQRVAKVGRLIHAPVSSSQPSSSTASGAAIRPGHLVRPLIQCPDCCFLILACVGAGACCLFGGAPCCGPGLGICAGAGARCFVCPCSF